MELRHLRYFSVVAEEENFNRAAKKLFVAQSALSTQIRDLEADLNVVLFERLPKGVRLTPAGIELFKHAKRILRETDDARAQVRRAATGQTGTLRIGFTSMFYSPYLPEIIRRYRLERPEVELKLENMTSAQQLEGLARRTLDIGCLYCDPEGHSDLRLQKIAVYGQVAVFPTKHKLAAKRPLSIADLKNQPFILGKGPRYAPLYDWLIAACRARGFSPDIIQEVSDTESIFSLVSVGLGIGVGTSVYLQLRVPAIVFREIADAYVPWHLHFAWRRDDRSPQVKSFAETALSVIKG
jgi:DNA-binding transcriptional LysR family regulator